jgi:cell division protein FtsB
MRTELDRLETDLAQQKQISDQLQLQLNALRNDPKTVERLAREKLGYAKPDETVVRFETNGTGR